MSKKNKFPKMHSYMLFMQEKRHSVPAWSNKTNTELQLLCDPLWRALPKEEKDKYKAVKKEQRRAEQERLFRPAVRVAGLQPVLLGLVESTAAVWVVPVRELKAVQDKMAGAELRAVRPEEVRAGSWAAAKYSQDQQVYRCQITKVDGDKAKVLFADYGNTDVLKITDLQELPQELQRINPLAVKVNIKTDGVKKTEKIGCPVLYGSIKK